MSSRPSDSSETHATQEEEHAGRFYRDCRDSLLASALGRGHASIVITVPSNKLRDHVIACAEQDGLQVRRSQKQQHRKKILLRDTAFTDDLKAIKKEISLWHTQAAAPDTPLSVPASSWLSEGYIRKNLPSYSFTSANNEGRTTIFVRQRRSS